MTLTLLAWRRQRGPILAAAVVVAFYVWVALTDPPEVGRLLWSAGDFVAPWYVLSIGFGACWAAPLLAREQQQRTIDLAFTQSVSRVRWLLTWITPVVVVASAGALVVFAALHRPIRADSWLPWHTFELRDVVFGVGYILFAVALGLCAGALMGRTLPAVVVTIVGTLVMLYPIRLLTWIMSSDTMRLAWLAIAFAYAAAGVLLAVTVWWMAQKAPRS